MSVPSSSCWVCCDPEGGAERQKCDCCGYLNAYPQPKLTIPRYYSTSFNSKVDVAETTRLSKLYFLERQTFGDTPATLRASSSDRKRARADNADSDDDDDSDSDDDNSDNDGIDALWSNAVSHTHKKKRRDETAEQSIRREVLRSLDPTKTVPLCVTRLLKFLRLLELLNTKPNADEAFQENEYVVRLVVASILKYVVGEKEWKENGSVLYPLIESVRDLSDTINVLWYTMRQQGKTTVLSRIAAALSMVSPVGGELIYVYSTAMNRAQGLVDEAKDYLYWVNSPRECDWVHPALVELGLPTSVTFYKDNSEVFIVDSWFSPGTRNTVKARPKNADSCRGDAFKWGIFDEAAFIAELFMRKFAMPLLAVAGRVFTLATTPAPINSYFDGWAKKQMALNEKNINFFKVINHSLMCDTCYEKGVDVCCHRLYLIPPWKSVNRIKSMFGAESEKGRRDFQAEVSNLVFRRRWTVVIVVVVVP